MTPPELTRARDRLDPAPAASPAIDLSPLLGAWVVFEPGTTGITKVEIDEGADGVSATVFGSGPEGEPPGWGRAPAHVFTDDVAGSEAWAFRTGYDHGFESIELFGYLNRGVLAVDSATSFTDGEGRSPYFTRELFYRR